MDRHALRLLILQNMGKIVAIGGGEIGRPGYPVETTQIDKEIIRLTRKKSPKLLFIPTASSDSEGYVEAVKKHFGQRLGCKIDVLFLIKESPTYKQIKNKILNSDIVYVGGGNTLMMLKIWRRHRVDKILASAYRQGIVLSGLSAGAVCWFKFASSDSLILEHNSKAALVRIRGLNFFPLTLSPHHLREKQRKKALITIMKKTPGVGIALDDYSALEIIDDAYRIITSKPIAKVHKVYYRNKKLVYKEIKKQKVFMPISDILSTEERF